MDRALAAPSRPRVEFPIMASRDGLDLLRAQLRLALAALPVSPRRIEDALGIGHGTLPRLLDGRMDLKLRHLLEICRLLKIHPRELIERGLPDWKAEHRLDDWKPLSIRKAVQPLALSDEVLEAVRTVVREEISRAGLTPGAERQTKRRNR